MKAIHELENWKKGAMENGPSALWCSLHGVQENGLPYPPINWLTICYAYGWANAEVTARLPQVWTEHKLDHERVVGVVWEICAQHEYGSFDQCSHRARDAVNALVCEVHTHLGTNYNQFVIA